MLGILEEGRQCYARRAWDDARRALALAEEEAPLAVEDLERLATAAYMSGREREFQRFEERVHQACLDRGDHAGAARSGFWLGLSSLLRGEAGAATGWLSKSRRLVQGRDCVEHGYLLLPTSELQLAQGRAYECVDSAVKAVDIGERFADADLLALSRHLQGRGLIRLEKLEQVEQGLALLDEAMLAVVTGRLSPVVTGLVYCSVLEACQQACAFNRAREWTAALARWCDEQPQMVAFTGACRVHRAEVMQLNGAWPEALAEARRACDKPVGEGGSSPPATALYRQGELYRLCGQWPAAEASFRLANQLGFEPQPGLALLRLDQGSVAAACAMILRVMEAAAGKMARARLLAAAVEILLAAGDSGGARRASRELDDIAAAAAAPAVSAMAAYARGASELDGGDPPAALGSLREGLVAWQQVGAPFEVARVRVLLGKACSLLGDRDGGMLEFSAAREVFKRLGAMSELARLEALCPSAVDIGPDARGLSRRELQVLRLVCSGKTNKAIANGLGLSERTVDRHVSNIFDKLGVASRAGATAYAYEHGLIGPPG